MHKNLAKNLRIREEKMGYRFGMYALCDVMMCGCRTKTGLSEMCWKILTSKERALVCIL